jgi:hypothetical protein
MIKENKDESVLDGSIIDGKGGRKSVMDLE